MVELNKRNTMLQAWAVVIGPNDIRVMTVYARTEEEAVEKADYQLRKPGRGSIYSQWKRRKKVIRREYAAKP